MESLMITQDYLQAVKALKDAITQSRYRAIIMLIESLFIYCFIKMF